MKLFITLAFAFSLYPLLGQNERSVESKPTAVTIYLTKAQVTRSLTTSIDQGRTDIIISGLSANLDPESIQISGKGSATILGIAHRQNFMTELSRPKQLKILYDSLSFYQRQVRLEQNKKEVLEKEEQLLAANQKFTGANHNLTIAELKTMSDYFRTKLSEIISNKSKQDDQIKWWNEKISRVNRQIGEQNEVLSRNTGELVVSVQADKSTSLQLELKYVVTNAGWSPVYDLRSGGLKDPVSFVYKANVYQSTGETWKDVRVTLSTANPNLSGTKPELGIWGLDVVQPIVYQQRNRNAELMMAAPMVAKDASEVEVGSISQDISIIQSTLTTEFTIGTPQTINSGPKPTVMDIRRNELKADYSYAVVPKLDKNAFLVAKVTGWDELDLLQGEANIFFEGTFVGKTVIDPTQIEDTLTLSMGRDQRIIITREKLKDLSSRKLIGSNQRELAVWQIGLRNTKTEPVRITVEDQVPISLNTQIEISNVDIQGGRLDKQTGKVIWSINLAPSENKTIGFRYEVKYPKDKIISGL